MKLYSYVLRYDNGLAPNPFWGICTLVVCKPEIRRTADIGDWIVGTGSAKTPLGNLSGQVVYVMRVSQKMTMAEYDNFCRLNYPEKIPDMKSNDYRKRIGDCIYDFSHLTSPVQRNGKHSEENIAKDLSGKYALLSDHFYYFGDHPLKLPVRINEVVHTHPGHKCHFSDELVEEFINWVGNNGYESNVLYGKPQQIVGQDCSSVHMKKNCN